MWGSEEGTGDGGGEKMGPRDTPVCDSQLLATSNCPTMAKTENRGHYSLCPLSSEKRHLWCEASGLREALLLRKAAGRGMLTVALPGSNPLELSGPGFC